MRNGLAAAVLLLSGGGCVTRVMHVRSDPPGALVYLNDTEAGRTPFDREFTWYGNYDVVARLDGYESAVVVRPVNAPWWQFVPFDLATDFLPVRDDETIHVTLTPTPPADPAAALTRAQRAKQQLQSGERTSNRNVLATRPAATRPATVPGQEP